MDVIGKVFSLFCVCWATTKVNYVCNYIFVARKFGMVMKEYERERERESFKKG